MTSLFVRYEGQQQRGTGGSFPLFTVLIRRTVRLADGITRVVYEPGTTLSCKTLYERFKVFAPDFKLNPFVEGTIFELPL